MWRWSAVLYAGERLHNEKFYIKKQHECNMSFLSLLTQLLVRQKVCVCVCLVTESSGVQLEARCWRGIAE